MTQCRLCKQQYDSAEVREGIPYTASDGVVHPQRTYIGKSCPRCGGPRARFGR